MSNCYCKVGNLHFIITLQILFKCFRLYFKPHILVSFKGHWLFQCSLRCLGKADQKWYPENAMEVMLKSTEINFSTSD